VPKKSSKEAKSQRRGERALLEKVNLNAAGIDVGADTHWVAVPADRDENPVRGIYQRSDRAVRMAQAMPDPNNRDGIDRSLLDPAFSNAREKRL